MPRGPRLDAPGALHHVVARGLDGEAIFRDEQDRLNLLNRLDAVLTRDAAIIYAWVLMLNHIHLLIRTLRASLPSIMRRLLTGHAIYFNRRHKRTGHLFQNRYWSCLVEDEPYFDNLVAYIHLNPVQLGPCISLAELDSYPWTGHAAMLSGESPRWYDPSLTLSNFGDTRKKAISNYMDQLDMFITTKNRRDFSGGGLIRSKGGIREVLQEGRGRERWASDERILGSGQFVEKILGEMEKTSISPNIHRPFEELLQDILSSCCYRNGITTSQMISGSRKRSIVAARKQLVQAAAMLPGYKVTYLANVLNISPKSVYRILQAS